MGTILVWATAWAFVALVARMVAQPQRRGGGGGGGRRLRAELDSIYGGEHEYARVSPAAFPEADLAFYDRSTAELEAMGFRRIGDVEDLTLTRVYPERRAFLRVFVDEGGAIRAAVYHLRVRSGGMFLSAMGMGPRDLHVVECVTESPRGHFVATSNTKGLDKLTTPKEVEVERMDVGAALRQVVERHRARLTERARRRGADSPVPMWTWDDVLGSIQRGHVASAKHRQAVGGLSREEIERFTGHPLTAAEETFLREVRGEATETSSTGVAPTPAVATAGATTGEPATEVKPTPGDDENKS